MFSSAKEVKSASLFSELFIFWPCFHFLVSLPECYIKLWNSYPLLCLLFLVLWLAFDWCLFSCMKDCYFLTWFLYRMAWLLVFQSNIVDSVQKMPKVALTYCFHSQINLWKLLWLMFILICLLYSLEVDEFNLLHLAGYFCCLFAMQVISIITTFMIFLKILCLSYLKLKYISKCGLYTCTTQLPMRPSSTHHYQFKV